MDTNVCLLNDEHDCSHFKCGERELNRYIKRDALAEQANDLSKTYVWIKDKRIAGYYSLAMSALDKTTLPPEYAETIRYPTVPAALIGRLAIHIDYQKKHAGRALLMHALEKCLAHGCAFGMHLVFVDALHEQASLFYEKFGFRRLPNNPLRLFYTMEQMRELFSDS